MASADALSLTSACNGCCYATTFGISDNGAAFTSAKFQKFARLNGIRHITTAPYHPSSNGQAECMVQTTKEALSCITK
ncbi:hypothetical protein QTP70_019513, partial [Hemibagrus guttatus]